MTTKQAREYATDYAVINAEHDVDSTYSCIEDAYIAGMKKACELILEKAEVKFASWEDWGATIDALEEIIKEITDAL